MISAVKDVLQALLLYLIGLVFAAVFIGAPALLLVYAAARVARIAME